MLYGQNRKSFTSVCHGQLGRYVIYSNAKEITRDNITQELGKALAIHWSNRREIEYLDRYYRGDQPIIYREKKVRPEINNKIVENRAFEIVEFFTAQDFGEPIQYVRRGTDENVSTLINRLNDFMFSEDKGAHDIELGRWRNICGTGYRLVYNDTFADIEMDEAPFGLETLDPRFVFVVYSSGAGKRPLYSVQQVKDEYDVDKYIIKTRNKKFIIQNGKIISENPNYLGINVIEYPLNERRIGRLEVVVTILDAINKTQSDRLNGVEQFIQAFMKFVNCEIDKETFLEMVSLGALNVKTVNPSMPADVSMVSSQLDQSQTQVSKDDLITAIRDVLGMPSREGNTGGDTGQAVYLRNGWDFAEGRAELDEPIFQKSERNSLRVVLKILDGKTDIRLKLSDIEIKVTRSKTDNMQLKSQVLNLLLTSGVEPDRAFKTCNLWSDPEEAYVESKPYLDAKYKTKDQIDSEAAVNKPPPEGDGTVD
ncbi:phage portal protein [Blautia sp. JLR.GB0024]|uniref:phage portal protein n=1 Tax=Blautia sp. JLR.GB0024 TaxID=3123295 RepID=UPI003003CC78